ncbi:type IV pilin N-terminal domain-containing protein [Methanoregula sp.]|uniref:type IV pilin N-terminal domain-containing protein n=1 Tax=Methanoregula sp. TaxID=2052170 RepID=UPI00236F2966|nr:type IV pilin N-terminal domain-containing protein [Methanoregula sp.]MDD1685805.1 type IV pilin N-terminal domain-containing protein [Methanoregula sp.]
MMTKHYHKQDSAVSPVVGVMLMLVVTIIIAAVVSAFAGGVSGAQTKTPVATITASEFYVGGSYDLTNQTTGFGKGVPAPISDPADPAADVYIIFEHKGGDSVNLANIEMKFSSLQKPAEKSTVSNANTPLTNTNASGLGGQATGVGDKSLITGFSNNWSKYMERMPDHGTIVKPGDKFVVHADYVAKYKGYVSVNWLKNDGTYPFFVNAGDVLTYQIIDKSSNKMITSGQIAVPEITG